MSSAFKYKMMTIWIFFPKARLSIPRRWPANPGNTGRRGENRLVFRILENEAAFPHPLVFARNACEKGGKHPSRRARCREMREKRGRGAASIKKHRKTRHPVLRFATVPNTSRPPTRRAISSVGRAPRLHRGCRRFESVIAHHSSPPCYPTPNVIQVLPHGTQDACSHMLVGRGPDARPRAGMVRVRVRAQIRSGCASAYRYVSCA